MKTSIVPAQITNVEDKITSNLTLKQMLLLASAIFVDFGIYALVPNTLKLSIYKFALMIVTGALLAISAIRYKGKLILEWVYTLYRYNNNPRYYVYNKNDIVQRLDEVINPEIKKAKPLINKNQHLTKRISRTRSEDGNIRDVILSPNSKIIYSSGKKGKLHVTFS